MDEDLSTLSREQLVVEVRKLRNGIRAHRDVRGRIRYRQSLDAQAPDAPRSDEPYKD